MTIEANGELFVFIFICWLTLLIAVRLNYVLLKKHDSIMTGKINDLINQVSEGMQLGADLKLGQVEGLKRIKELTNIKSEPPVNGVTTVETVKKETTTVVTKNEQT